MLIESFYSNFEDIFDVRHFIESLRDEVRIVKRLPKRFSRKYGYKQLAMPPVSWSNEKYYSEQVCSLICFWLRKEYYHSENSSLVLRLFSEKLTTLLGDNHFGRYMMWFHTQHFVLLDVLLILSFFFSCISCPWLSLMFGLTSPQNLNL